MYVGLSPYMSVIYNQRQLLLSGRAIQRTERSVCNEGMTVLSAAITSAIHYTVLKYDCIIENYHKLRAKPVGGLNQRKRLHYGIYESMRLSQYQTVGISR